MSALSYDELLKRYSKAEKTIMELREELENKDWKIDLLQTNISELEEILYDNGIFKHFN